MAPKKRKKRSPPQAKTRAEKSERAERLVQVGRLLADGYGYHRTAELTAEKYGIGLRMAEKDIQEIYALWEMQAEEAIALSRAKAIRRTEANLEKLAEIRDERARLETVLETPDGPIPVYRDHRITAIREMTGVDKFLSLLQGTRRPKQVETSGVVALVNLTDEKLDEEIEKKIQSFLKAEAAGK